MLKTYQFCVKRKKQHELMITLNDLLIRENDICLDNWGAKCYDHQMQKC